MIHIICYSLPAVIAMWIHEKLNKKDYNLKEFIYYFAFYTVIINLIIAALLTFFLQYPESALTEDVITQRFITKYLSLSMCVSIFLPVVITIFKKLFKIEISIDKLEISSKKEKGQTKTSEKKKTKKK